MLGHRLRRWPNISQTLDRCVVFAGIGTLQSSDVAKTQPHLGDLLWVGCEVDKADIDHVGTIAYGDHFLLQWDVLCSHGDRVPHLGILWKNGRKMWNIF